MNKPNIKRLGLFGGTFNPIHLGHMAMAHHFYQQLQLKKLVFVPAGQPYHKSLEGNATVQDRYNMVEQAITDYPEYSLTDCELMRIGDTYTVDTLTLFRDKLGEQGEIWWLMGADSLLQLHTWYRYLDIFQLANIAVVARGGLDLTQMTQPLAHLVQTGLAINLDEHVNHGKITILDMPEYDISSSQVRKLAAQGRDLTPYLPAHVCQYIFDKHLYI